jgi:hypothetical protein
MLLHPNVMAYYADNTFTSYVSDRFRLRSISTVGLDNVTFETDYPQADGSWPNRVDVARRELAHLAASDRLKILRSNAIRMLSLDLDQQAYN